MCREQINNTKQKVHHTHMSEQNEQHSEAPEVDPVLTNDMDDVKPQEPLVPKNDYAMTVKKVEETRSEKTGNKMLVIQLSNLNPITAIDGEVRPAGAMNLFHRIVITPTEKLTQEQIKRTLKRFMLACGVTSGPVYPLSQYVGKNVMASVGFSKPNDEYPEERNEVKGLVIP